VSKINLILVLALLSPIATSIYLALRAR